MDFKKNKLLSLSCNELQRWLQSRNIPENVSKTLKENCINGTLFLKLTRADLIDLFPDSFLYRKELWDLLVDQRQEEFDSMVVHSNSKNDADNGQDEDDDLSETTSPTVGSMIPPTPPLKKGSILTTLKSDARKKRSHDEVEGGNVNLEEFKFPISKDMMTCEEGNIFPPKSIRTALIRDCYTCLCAAVGPHPSQAHFIFAAKKICAKLSVLKDKKPPAWPKDRAFEEWASVLYSLKKRSYNLKKPKLDSSSSTSSNSAETDADEADCAKHNSEILKLLKRNKGKEDAIKETMEVTFNERQQRMTTNELQANEVVTVLTKEFPFLVNELALSIELELHLKKTRGASNRYRKSNEELGKLGT